MQFLSSAALLSLAAVVAADQTFALTAKGSKINDLVASADDKLTVQNGDAGQITLEEPSGYASINGKYLQNSPEGIVLSDKAHASKDWGINENNKFRFGPSTGNDVFYACPGETGYTLQTFTCDNGEEVALLVGDASAAPSDAVSSAASSAAPSSVAASSAASSAAVSSVASSAASSEILSSDAAPSSYIYTNATNPTLTTKTYLSHTMVTVTKCPETVTNCPLNDRETVTTHQEVTLTTTYCPASETPSLPEPTTHETFPEAPKPTTEETTAPAPTTKETPAPAPTTEETTAPAPTEETTGPAPTEETTQQTTLAEQTASPSAAAPAVTSQYEGAANVARVAGAGIFAAAAAMLI